MEVQGFYVQPGQPILWQRIEAAVILLVCAALYYHLRLNGWLFLLLILVPDLSMVGYMKSPAVGGALYNFAHNYGVPLLVLTTGWALASEVLIVVGLIWLAHCGMDRAVGYGLKYPTHFQHTHLGKIGRDRPHGPSA